MVYPRRQRVHLFRGAHSGDWELCSPVARLLERDTTGSECWNGVRHVPGFAKVRTTTVRCLLMSSVPCSRSLFIRTDHHAYL